MQNQTTLDSKTFVVKKPTVAQNRKKLRLPKMNRLPVSGDPSSAVSFSKLRRRELGQKLDAQLATRIEMIVTLQEFHEHYQRLCKENYPWLEHFKAMFDLLHKIFQESETTVVDEKEFLRRFSHEITKAELIQNQWWEDDDYRALFWREWISQMQYIFFFENEVKEPESLFVKAMRFTNKYVEVLSKIEKMLKERHLSAFRAQSEYAGVDHSQAKNTVLTTSSAPRN